MCIYESSFDGSVHIEFKDGREFDVDCTALANESHDPGCMYLRNGDPGYPPEDDFEITNLDVQYIHDTLNDADVLWRYDKDEQFKHDIDESVMYELEQNYQDKFEPIPDIEEE